MNYYDNIKQELLNNEIYKKVKDYSKNKNDLETYYKVGKILFEAGRHYGESIINEYSKKLAKELNKKYTERTLRRFRQFYIIFRKEKWSTVSTKLTWSHYCELSPLNSINKINYYVKICIEQNLSVRELRNKIKLNEYDRLDEKTKEKLISQEQNQIQDFNLRRHIIIFKRIRRWL